MLLTGHRQFQLRNHLGGRSIFGFGLSAFKSRGVAAAFARTRERHSRFTRGKRIARHLKPRIECAQGEIRRCRRGRHAELGRVPRMHASKVVGVGCTTECTDASPQVYLVSSLELPLPGRSLESSGVDGTQGATAACPCGHVGARPVATMLLCGQRTCFGDAASSESQVGIPS